MTEHDLMRPLRIEMTLPTLAAAGMETVVCRLAIRLAQRGHDVGVTCIEDGGDLVPRLMSAGVDVAVVPTPGLTTNLHAPALRARFVSRALDVLHTHNGTWLKAARAAARVRVPAIIHTVHGLLDREPWFSPVVVRAAMHHTHAITAVSSPLSDYFRMKHGVTGTLVIPNGIDIAAFAPVQDSASQLERRYALGLPLKGMLIGHVARLVPVKNQSMLLRAFQQVVHALPETRLVILGEGPLRSQLEAEAAALAIDDHVHFAGAVNDVARWLPAFDLFVLSSTAEGTPISILEAMASGLCVVATAVGGNVELLDGGRAGLLVPSDDSEALAAALLAAIRDKELRAALAAAGRARVEQNYSEHSMIVAYERLYRELLDASTTIPGAALAQV